MPEEKNKPNVSSSGSLFNSELEERKPTRLSFGQKGGKQEEQSEPKPRRLKFGSPKEKQSNPVQQPERKPTVITFPKKKAEEPKPPTRLKFDPPKPLPPEPKPTRFEFPRKAISKKVEAKPRILFGGKNIRRRLEINQGDIKELYPNIDHNVLEKARRAVLILNVTDRFDQTCMQWGLDLQEKAAKASQDYANVVNGELIPNARTLMAQILDNLTALQFNVKEKRGWWQELTDPRTPKQLFQEKYAGIEQDVNKLKVLLPSLNQVRQEIRKSTKALDVLEDEFVIRTIAGELVEFRTTLGDVKVQHDPDLLKADLEVLRRRLKSMSETLGNIEALKIQQTTLYGELTDLVERIQNILLVELPSWYNTILSSGFKGEEVDPNAAWSWLSKFKK